MKITWLGQAGLLFETKGTTILVDPYLSDSVAKTNPDFHRRYPVDEAFFNIKPNVIICTHDHADHTDTETLSHYLCATSSITVLAPEAAWQRVRAFGGNNNYVKFNRHSSFSVEDVLFRAVKAEHSDIHPIGVIIEAEGKKYYVTGDTLYNEDIFPDLPDDIFAVFLPINGAGNNMNHTDAERFCKRVGAKYAVPLHWGLFDSLSPDIFECENKVVPKPFCEITLE